jgi:hypothetical protein
MKTSFTFHISSVNLEECKKLILLTGLKQDWETCQRSNHFEHAARSHQSQVLKLYFFWQFGKRKKGRFNDGISHEHCLKILKGRECDVSPVRYTFIM